jgi:hypothetical protein
LKEVRCCDASFIEWFAEEGKRIYGDTIPVTRPTSGSLHE